MNKWMLLLALAVVFSSPVVRADGEGDRASESQLEQAVQDTQDHLNAGNAPATANSGARQAVVPVVDSKSLSQKVNELTAEKCGLRS